MIERKTVYLDNAATTPLRKEVADAMCDLLYNHYGNPSAIHAIGRDAKGIIEQCRKTIADLLGAKSSEIVFTSGGTEADNMAIRCSVRDLGIRHIITSAIEHKAVLDTVKDLATAGTITYDLLRLDEYGRPDMEELDQLCSQNPGSLVSLMHGNNEVGTLIDLERTSMIAHNHGCIFHSDTVQTMGHYPIQAGKNCPDFMTCSAHKINGPKGIGFLYISSDVKLKALITGGGQEKSLRAGTENTSGIVGLSKAMQLAFRDMENDHIKISKLKQHAIKRLKENIPGVCFNGDISEEGGLYTVLNISLPPNEIGEMLLFKLDLEGICVSGGSACNSGASAGSHVLQAMNHPSERTGLRMSFGIYNDEADIEYAISKLATFYAVETA
jgi:cysteine desulfurase